MARAGILAAVLATCFLGAAKADDAPAIDTNLPTRQDSTTLGTVIYSFKERFKYARTDTADYGTIAQFNRLYPEAYWTDRLSKLTNEDGSLAWLVSQAMMALVTLYDKTGDPWYLKMLGRYAEAAMAARDDLTGKKDNEGRTVPGWGTTRYGAGERRIYLVHSGLIIEPILEYAIRAPKLPGWSGRDETRRKELIERCRQTLLWHDYQLDPGTTGDEAAYIAGREEEDRRNAYQPFNRQNLFARDFYLLYQLTGDSQFEDRSRKLYAFFRNHIERTPSDAYVWEYEPLRWVNGPIHTAVCDDISHASYAIEPVLPACLSGFVFTPADVARFARTFTRYIYLGDGVFQTNIGCQVAFAPRIMDRLYAWLPVSTADPQVYRLIREFLEKNVEKPQPLAIAYLIAYRPKGLTGIDTRAR